MLPVASRTVLGGVKVDGLKGVKIGADGMLSVDFSSMPDDQLEEVVLAMVQEGGGISVDGEGKLYVDFESMPTDKFEAMLKSIKVPIWLTKNTNFYVNSTTGSDVLDEGRGLSADKPFKNLQTCINYVCDTYNLSRYTAYINCADVVLTSGIELSSYTATSGQIVIRKDASSESDYGVEINYSPTATDFAARINGGTWSLYDVKISVSNENLASGSGHFGGILIAGLDASLTIRNADITVSIDANYGTSGNWCIYCSNGNLYISSGVTINGVQTLANPTLTAFGVGPKGMVEYDSGLVPLKLTGSFNRAICLVAGGLFVRNAAYSNNTNIDTTEVVDVGYKYNVYNNGGINSSGVGTDYFGTKGTERVDAETFAWYR